MEWPGIHLPAYASDRMRVLMREVAAFADCEQPVVVEGETGVGKEYVARLLHEGHSTRCNGPFVPVNCGAIPEGLFESLFFGHARGAFTGAMQPHAGYFEQAKDGTLFLDEIGELPLHQQVKLLRSLEDSVVTRVGAEAPIPTNVRLVAATNRLLRDMVRHNSFRADLFYRIAVVELRVPNLAERGREERLALFDAMLSQALGDRADAVGPPPQWLLDRVGDARLPGNVRQLRNLAERVGVVARQLGQWDRMLIGHVMALAEDHADTAAEAATARQHTHDARERQRVLDALQAHNWRRQPAADELGISRKSLWEKMRRYAI